MIDKIAEGMIVLIRKLDQGIEAAAWRLVMYRRGSDKHKEKC